MTMKTSSFARFARAFLIFWHFEDLLVLSTTWNDLSTGRQRLSLPRYKSRTTMYADYDKAKKLVLVFLDLKLSNLSPYRI